MVSSSGAEGEVRRDRTALPPMLKLLVAVTDSTLCATEHIHGSFG
jgi:hypothetical protein